MTGADPVRFAGLSHGDRSDLFGELSDVRLRGDVSPIACRFGEHSGWLVRNAQSAQAILQSSGALKGRPSTSRSVLGGLSALDGNAFRKHRRAVVAAIRESAADTQGMTDHFRVAATQIGSSVSASALSEVFAVATATHLVGLPPGTLSGATLRAAVDARTIRMESEAKHGAAPADAFGDDNALEATLADACHSNKSAFTTSLLMNGIDGKHIAEELLNLLVASWTSVAAAALSACSLGAGGALDRRIEDEILRMYPPSWLIARRLQGSITDLPAASGDIVVITPWLLHRHPWAWSDGDTFRPDRWVSSRHPWYLPFGQGLRRCPAEPYARAQLRSAVGIIRDSAPTGAPVVGLVEGRSAAAFPGRLELLL